MKKSLFRGVATALVTPFKNGEVDYSAFTKLIKYQLKNSVDALLILGTTGEAPTLSMSERKKMIQTARKLTEGYCPLIVGTGSNCTEKACEYALQAERLGADALCIVTPFYNKTTQKGVFLHYEQISLVTSLPIIVYNVPSRTGLNILPKTYVRLAKIPNVVGIKEANGNIDHVLGVFESVGKILPIYCGADNLNYLFACLGGSGSISVVSNLLPSEVGRIFKEKESGLFLHKKLSAFARDLFLEVNPTCIKYALSFLNFCESEVRLPLCETSSKTKKVLEKDLIALNFKASKK